MTDTQSKIIVALRRSNAALTQAELAKRTKLSAQEVRENCYQLGANGYVNFRGRAMQAACTFCEVNAAPTAAKVLQDALREPHSAKSDFPGVTPSDDD